MARRGEQVIFEVLDPMIKVADYTVTVAVPPGLLDWRFAELVFIGGDRVRRSPVGYHGFPAPCCAGEVHRLAARLGVSKERK